MARLYLIRKQARSVALLVSLGTFASSALAQQDPSSFLVGDSNRSGALSPPLVVMPSSTPALVALPQNYHAVRVAHAVFVSVAWLVFFPLGGILIRVLESRNVVWIHGVVQGIGSLLFIIGAGCGIWMAQTDGVIGHYHPIIGISLLAALSIQPITELLNHFFYRENSKIIWAAHVHLWFGRFLITVGIIQGGLGFVFSASMSGAKQDDWPRILYGVAATVVWIVYMAGAVIWPMVRHTFPSYMARR